jgi:thymidylate synthase (FAD)
MVSHTECLDKKVLDHGMVRLVDCMPSVSSEATSFESAIVQMARVSYGTGTKSFREDIGLVRYLLENDHTSPFEGVALKFHIKMPIFVARQWVRHRTASINEYSARYSVLEDDFYIPDPERLTTQSETNKQGSSEVLIKNPNLVCEIINNHSNNSYKIYEELLSLGLSRELARVVVPVNVYTQMYWVINLHNLLKFLKLRMDSHAQYEIRVYADAIFDIMREIAPNIMDTWKSSSMNSVKFTEEEINAINGSFSFDETKVNLPPNFSVRKKESLISKIKKIIKM